MYTWFDETEFHIEKVINKINSYKFALKLKRMEGINLGIISVLFTSISLGRDVMFFSILVQD